MSKTEKFKEEKKFNIRNQSKGDKFCELFLQKESNGDYWVSVIGKNGEKRSDVKVQVTVYHPWFIKGKKVKPITLITDKDGRVKLG
jgi:hypothetical protein